MTGAVLGRREVKVSMPARKEASTVLPDLASATIQPRSLCTSRSTSGPRASRLARPRERQHRILAGAFSHQRSQAAGVHGASVRPYSCIFMDLQLNCIMTVVQPRVCRRKGRSLRPAPSLARHSSSARSARGQSQSSVWHLPRAPAPRVACPQCRTHVLMRGDASLAATLRVTWSGRDCCRPSR